MRLDKYLYKNHFTSSRNQAQELINSHKVKVDGQIITKSSYQVENVQITILEEQLYVSRAAYKLKTFLEKQPVLIENRCCLDIGSSTGGFVQVLCEYGAQSVTAVDVGKGQLHPKLLQEHRVKSFEETDIRDFKSETTFDLVTCDVSFVGISYIAKEIDRLSSDEIIILFKPQFEVGRYTKRDKRGVVKDAKAIILAFEKFEALTKTLGWQQVNKVYSEVKGKEGNEEIFYYFKKRQN
ncbi:MAG: TlyA family RNA methyltransferase [Epsilonproteobacteria bacterium]|nr:TlyA family RNA methyltransferase [Campylobacterota bacterium]